MKQTTTVPLSEQFPPVLPRKRWRWNGLLLGVGLGIVIMAIVYGMFDVSLFPGSDRVLSLLALAILVPALILVLRHEHLIRKLRRARWPVEVIYPEDRGPVGFGV